jgi:hypothetical protein
MAELKIKIKDKSFNTAPLREALLKTLTKKKGKK